MKKRTALITTLQGIGVGIMGQTMSKNISSIDMVFAKDISEYINFSCKTNIFFDKPTIIFKDERELLEKKLLENTNLVYIEDSSNLAQFSCEKNIFIPMWEQGSTDKEIYDATEIIAVCKKAKEFIEKKYDLKSTYLPYPIETGVIKFKHRTGRPKNILYNGGSLGGNLRKGVLQAIESFQISEVSKSGINLIIHSFTEPTPEIIKAIEKDPNNIIWTNKFFKNYFEIYEMGDFLLFPSKMEGHAMVVLEAMAAGLPVLCTDYAPMNEYEEESEYKIKVLHKLESPQSIAEPYNIIDCYDAAQKIRNICNIDISKKSLQARHFIDTNMSWDVLRSKWEEVCR